MKVANLRAASYHAGKPMEQRLAVQRDFAAGQVRPKPCMLPTLNDHVVRRRAELTLFALRYIHHAELIFNLGAVLLPLPCCRSDPDCRCDGGVWDGRGHELPGGGDPPHHATQPGGLRAAGE